MNEVNERWQRHNRQAKRLTGLGILAATILWPISYYASYPAAMTGQGIWFASLSTVSLIAAIALTVASSIGISAIATDEPPLPGDNR